MASRIVPMLCWLVSLPAAVQTGTAFPRVISVIPSTETVGRPYMDSFREDLRDVGQVEGKTIQLETRYANGDPARFAVLIRGSVAERPAVLVVAGLAGARLAHDATTTIPVVIATASDLVDAGVVDSFARPGGNITGISDLADETAAKRLELLKAALPGTSRVALLVNPDFPATPKIEARVESAAQLLRVKITRYYATDRASMALAIDAMGKSGPDALLVGGDSILTGLFGELIDQATARRIPVAHFWPGTAERGALFSLQADVHDNFRRAAGYVDRILNGAKPADLAIYQPTRYEFVVNAKTARALGIALPQALLLRADRVIE